jgi:hypothetical protein
MLTTGGQDWGRGLLRRRRPGAAGPKKDDPHHPRYILDVRGVRHKPGEEAVYWHFTKT